MEVATVVYKSYLASRGVNRRRAWAFTRRLLIKLLSDPTCSFNIHGMHMQLPLSHELPYYIKQHRFHDTLPYRISDYIHQTQGRLCCIDVGANIGDTIAAFYKKDTDTFLAIEPTAKFRKFLVKNWGWNKNVTVVSDVCSSASSKATFAIRERYGTASIRRTENGIKVNTRTLDDIANDYCFTNANVIKIDTDGHDFQIIAGSKVLLSQNTPVIVFECDAFENTEYVEDCLQTLEILREIGYNHFLIYDNYGNILGIFSTYDLSSFKNLLFYQLTSHSSNVYYFDILAMKDYDMWQFYKRETYYFADNMHNKSLERTAIAATEL